MHAPRSFTALVAVVACGAPAADCQANFVGFTFESDSVNGYSRCRVYAQFDSASDVLLSVFNVSGLSGTAWHQEDLAGGTWAPQLTTNAELDSFVTIGGVPDFSNSTTGDLNWGAAGFFQPGIPDGAGWFNSLPANLQGAVDATFKSLIGQFVTESPHLLPTIGASVSYSQGIGTPTMFGSGTASLCFPAPGAASAFAFAFAGLVPTRRRPGALATAPSNRR